MVRSTGLVAVSLFAISSLHAMELTSVSQLREAEENQAWLVRVLQAKINHSDSKNFKQLLGFVAHNDNRLAIANKLLASSLEQAKDAEQSLQEDCLLSRATRMGGVSIAGFGLVNIALPFIHVVSSELALPLTIIGIAITAGGAGVTSYSYNKKYGREMTVHHQNKIQCYLHDIGAQEMNNDTSLNAASDDNV